MRRKESRNSYSSAWALVRSSLLSSISCVILCPYTLSHNPIPLLGEKVSSATTFILTLELISKTRIFIPPPTVFPFLASGLSGENEIYTRGKQTLIHGARDEEPTLITLSFWLYQCRNWNWKSVASKPCGNKKCSSQRFSYCWQFW